LNDAKFPAESKSISPYNPMIDALLIPFWNACPSAHVRLLGMAFEDRIALQAEKLGFKRILTRLGPEEVSDLPEELLIFFPNVLLSDGTWRRLRSLAPERDTLTLAHEFDSLAAVRCRDPRLLSGAFRESESYSALMAKLKARLRCEFISIDSRDWVPFASGADRDRVERWLLRGLIKESEGFMSRHVERKISLAVTRSLVDTGITPNGMTFASVGIGLAGAFFFAAPKSAYHVLGALLFLLHSVLDGCDGELARLKFTESRWGGLIDFLGDNLVHAAVFAAIAAGIYARKPGPAPIFLAGSAVGGTLLSAGLVYWTTMKERVASGPLFTSVVQVPALGENGSSPIEKMADRLARRDFIYLVIVLAILGKVKWFLRLGAIGAPLYFLVLLALSLKNSIPSVIQLPARKASK
jgi:phosphatidylglycerophosphate synthase